MGIPPWLSFACPVEGSLLEAFLPRTKDFKGGYHLVRYCLPSVHHGGPPSNRSALFNELLFLILRYLRVFRSIVCPSLFFFSEAKTVLTVD